MSESTISDESWAKLIKNLRAAKRVHERFNPEESFAEALVKNMSFPGVEMFAARLSAIMGDDTHDEWRRLNGSVDSAN